MSKVVVRKYKRFNYKTRLQLEALYNSGVSVLKIEKELGFNNSSIYRELKLGYYEKLNSDYTTTKRYSADRAEQKSKFNTLGRAKDLKVGNDYEFIDFVEDMIIKKKYSPEAVLLFIRQNNIKFKTNVSVNTIYRYIDNGVFLHLKRENLPYRKRKRQAKKIAVLRPSKIGTSIEKRPEEACSRQSFGHWEFDSVVGKRAKGNTLLVLTERKTRMELIFRSEDKSAVSTVNVIDSLEKIFGNDFSKVFKSITCDNGNEFSAVKGLERSCIRASKRADFYFCHPYSSWERGSNEKQNQMIRRYIIKGTKIESYSDDFILYVQDWLNDYPRKIFGGKSSRQMFYEQLKLLNLSNLEKIF